MKTTRRFDWVGSFALLASVLMWSMVPPFLKSFAPYVDGWTTNGLRYPFAALLWLPALVWQYRRGDIPPAIWKLAWLPALANIIAQVLWAWIPYFIDASLMGFLWRFSVVFWVAGGLLLFAEERPIIRHPGFWMGLVLSLVGFTAMSLRGGVLPTGQSLIGVALALGCAFWNGAYGVFARYTLKGARPWVVFPIICWYTAIGMLGLMLVFGEPSQAMALPPWRVVMMMLSAVVGIAAAHLFFYIAIDHLGITLSGGMQLASPMFTALWSFWFFDERLSVGQWLGGVSLLFGGALLFLAQSAIKPAARNPLLPDQSEEFSPTPCSQD